MYSKLLIDALIVLNLYLAAAFVLKNLIIVVLFSIVAFTVVVIDSSSFVPIYIILSIAFILYCFSVISLCISLYSPSFFDSHMLHSIFSSDSVYVADVNFVVFVKFLNTISGKKLNNVNVFVYGVAHIL